MLLLFPRRYRHFALIALGVILIVVGLATGSVGPTIIGAAVLVWGLARTYIVLRDGRRSPGTSGGSPNR